MDTKKKVGEPDLSSLSGGTESVVVKQEKNDLNNLFGDDSHGKKIPGGNEDIFNPQHLLKN